MSRPLVALSALALTVALAGCGKSDDVAQPTRTLPGSPPTTAAGAQVCEPTTAAVPTGGKPTVTVPAGDAPTSLQTTDVIVGDGPEAKVGDKVAVQYVGVSKTTGQEFDSSWSRGNEPFTFTLGQGGVIKGWDQGVVGMKVGGQRTLVIPPDLGYGATGSGDKIPPNDTLVFTVDLVQVCSTPTTTGSTPGTTPGSTPGSVVSDVTTTTAKG